ncbi:methylated-DNA--[protein]-cysteine S-methyltransferase [Alteromonas sp. a30]|uniref:methylated-DNA--[protein]-cysteine S-methyltransferase n=1 Tax=Alteromonas sp. a30 TaxID=2730917 RepID=UPI00227EAA07|nr:methylated-DNA--[protein]-cysteine S-methyltransferase [Alteromonas sp. a30]MCY7294998.1 methylated-DNA--[protein]-cysteine S-methyltransferase [Alteromonas sp. a30]
MTQLEHNAYLDTRIGWFHIVATNHAITRIDHFAPPQDWTPEAEPRISVIDDAKQQLLEYFAGERTEFDLPLAPKGTAFQQQVWTALTTIPYGETTSYQDIASQINKPKGSQAVGQANGKNPISIVIPCHRVIGKNGGLTGYAGGLDRKSKLLALESRIKDLFD